MNKVSKLQKLYASFNGKEVEMFSWLDGLTYSQSFMVCMGAGPWKIGRRQKIQEGALRWLGKRDLYDTDLLTKRFDYSNTVDCFPLEWQKKTTQYLVGTLHQQNISMEKLCELLTDKYLCDDDYARKEFYKSCGSNGTKVLSLFCRDALKIDSFPIDRHVRRILKENDLPTNEDDIINLCRVARLDPRKVATAFVRTASVDNPHWNLIVPTLSL